MSKKFVGLDVGQLRDPSAIAVVECVDFTMPLPPYDGPRCYTFENGTRQLYRPPPKIVRRFNVLHCERVRLGTPYPGVVHRVRAILDRIGPDVELIVDATGVGRAVVDLFSGLGVYPIAVTFTAGEAVVESEGGYRVPKRDLVSTVEVLLQEGRLKIARGIRESCALIDELLSFRAGVSSSGRDTFGAAGSAHDDLVIALALACWRARELEKQLSGMPVAGISEHYKTEESGLDQWLGNPANHFRGGYRQPNRFVPGVGGITGVRPFWTRIR